MQELLDASTKLCDTLNELAKEHSRLNNTALHDLGILMKFKHSQAGDYVRIQYEYMDDTSVWGFVDARGDIFKPLTWVSVSQKQCGNIFTRTDYQHFSCCM
ncbi:MAG: hypothetical protein ACRC3J_05780 [Culicoidibacterales bacterium]